MSEWIFFMHPPRDDFIATMSDAERDAFEAHARWLRQLLAEGALIAAGPCLGRANTGVAIFEASSEEEAQRIVAGEPVTGGGYMRGDLRPYRLGILRGRDDVPGDSLPGVLDDHLAAEFITRDVDATMATMTDDPYLTHVPVLTGGIGWADVRRFYEEIFIGHWAADLEMQRVSRTVGADHVVDELVLSFTHDIVMSHMLPGVPPTGKPVRLAVCVVAGFRDGKVTHEHIYWDQASLLVQVGLLDPAGLPVAGAEQAEKVLDPRNVPANAMLGPDWPGPG